MCRFLEVDFLNSLAAAAILRAANVPSENIRLIGSVNLTDYTQVCPGKAGEDRQTSWIVKDKEGVEHKEDVHGTSGHVWLAMKLGNRWMLVNTTHDPFD